jgi:hypothetical protein
VQGGERQKEEIEREREVRTQRQQGSKIHSPSTKMTQRIGDWHFSRIGGSSNDSLLLIIFQQLQEEHTATKENRMGLLKSKTSNKKKTMD